MNTDHLESQQLSDWQGGRLTEPESEVVEHHLESCDGCAAMLDEMSSDKLSDHIRDILQPVESESTEGLITESDNDAVLERVGTILALTSCSS